MVWEALITLGDGFQNPVYMQKHRMFSGVFRMDQQHITIIKKDVQFKLLNKKVKQECENYISECAKVHIIYWVTNLRKIQTIKKT